MKQFVPYGKLPSPFLTTRFIGSALDDIYMYDFNFINFGEHVDIFFHHPQNEV